MMSQAVSSLTHLITQIISSLGYPGVALLMVLQTVAIPIPSEIILPFAGYLASLGRFNIWLIAFSGGLGSCLGASIAYYIGYKGGRPLVEKYGKMILISEYDLQLTDKFFSKNETWAIFFGQLLPVVRSFIAFPAGIAKANYRKFLVYTFAGSFVWSLVLAYVGLKLGPQWLVLRERFRWLDYVVVLAIIIFLIFWVWRHLRSRYEPKA